MLKNGRCVVIDGLVSWLGKRVVLGQIVCFFSFERYCQIIEMICKDFGFDYMNIWPNPIDFLIGRIGEDAVLDGFVYGINENEFTIFTFYMYNKFEGYTERN